jgi:transcriptional regulator with XRE-family HTH domain
VVGISDRLKEERMRLGKSQTAFAALAGVTKSAQIKWESGTSSFPTAPALAAFAEAGADVLYILSGKRTPDSPEALVKKIDSQVDEYERYLLDPISNKLADQSDDDAEKFAVMRATNGLNALLEFDAHLMRDETADRIKQLLEIVDDPSKLSLFRAADFAQNRKRRESVRVALVDYLGGAPYEPSGSIMNLLVRIALDYSVPVKILAELIWEVSLEIKGETGEPSGD